MAMKGPNLASGFHSSSCSILYSYIKPIPHPLPLLLSPVILLPARKKLPKTGQILLSETYTLTQ